MPRGSTCKARGCTANKTDNPELSFHSFPRNKERFKQWCELIKRPDLNHSKAISSRMSMRVCSLHFEDRMYMSPTNKSRLIWCAVPRAVEGESSPVQVDAAINTESIDSKASIVSATDAGCTRTDASEQRSLLELGSSHNTSKESKAFVANVIETRGKRYYITECLFDQDNSMEFSVPPSPQGDASAEAFTDTKEGIIRQNLSGRSEEDMADSASLSQQVAKTHRSYPATKRSNFPSSHTSMLGSEEFASTVSLMGSAHQASHTQGSSLGTVRIDVSSETRKSCKKSIENSQESVFHVKTEPVRLTEIQETGYEPLCQESHCSLSSEVIGRPSSQGKLLTPALSTATPSSNDSAQSSKLGLTQSHYGSSKTINNNSQLKNIAISCNNNNNNNNNTDTSSTLQRQTPLSLNVITEPSSTSVHSTGDVCASEPPGSQCHHPKTSRPGSPKITTDSVSANEESSEVNEDEMELGDETENDDRIDEDCVCDKCVAREEEADLAVRVVKSATRRTYSGPIQRQVVRTKSGGKRTFMILNKASLKNLQAKGLIQPLRKYMASHPHSVKPLKKKVNFQHPSVSSDNHSENSAFSEEENPALKKSLPSLVTQHAALDRCNRVSSRGLGSQPNVPSQTSAQAPTNPETSSQNPQNPVMVSWSPVNGSSALSFTFTPQVPPEVSQPSSSARAPMRFVTPPLFIGGSQPDANTQVPSGSNQKLCSQHTGNSSVPSSVKMEGSRDQAVAQSTTTSVISSKNSFQTNTVPSKSSKYAMQLPIVSTRFPLIVQEASGEYRELSQGEGDLNNDTEMISSCSPGSTSPTGTSPTGTRAQKPSDCHSSSVKLVSLPCKTSKGGLKMFRCSEAVEHDKEDSQPSKTRPKSTANVQWIALPSFPFHQPQPSPSEAVLKAMTRAQEAGIDKRQRQEMFSTGSSELSSSRYGGNPVTSPDQRGRMFNIPPPFKSANKELKKKYARLLNKHRQRYHLLLKKYKALEKKFTVVEDAGSPQQVIRDSRNFLSDEHVLFLESQMFLRNRPGTGNRFSRKFMKLMIEYYKRSPAGYRFLRTIFTIPSVKTVQKWLNRPIEFKGCSEEEDHMDLVMHKEDSETGCDEEASHPMFKAASTQEHHQLFEKFSQRESMEEEFDLEDDTAEDFDTEESGLEEMEGEEVHDEDLVGLRNTPLGEVGQSIRKEKVTIGWKDELHKVIME